MILLTEKLLDEIVRAAKRARPEEACGVLGGRIGKAHDLGVVGTGEEDEKVAGVRPIDYPVPEGGERDRVRMVERFIACRNADTRPEWRYTIDPQDQLDAFHEVDDAGLDLVGFFHSHPRGPRGPSETDLDRATWADMSYVIVALDGEEPWVGSWVFRKGNMEDEADEESGTGAGAGGRFEEERVVVTG